MPPSVTDHSASRAGQGGNMTSGSFFKVREREEAELQEARQKASIKWLVSKAYSNKPPGNIVEPYYKDHHDKDRLKPAVLHSLANAELYCMSMAALYQDPNYHNLNHWGIIQAMSRKGVFVSEPADCSLTETVLIQDAPLKLSAHMAVIEALMMLYVKEQVVPDRVISAVRRFSKAEEQPAEAEDALLCWVNQSLHAVRARLEEEATNNEVTVPKFPKIQDLSDFSDGVGLTAVAALYCPEDLLWTEIALGEPPSMSDSLCNIQLFHRFCSDSLPYSICHVSIEDIFYLHSSIKLAVSCLLADLFTVLEVKPAKCVQLPGLRKAIIIDLPDPDRVRTPSRSNGTSLRPDSRSDAGAGDDSFVVQRGRGVPTLTSVANSHRSMSPAGSDLGHKERLNQDTKSEERGETETPSLTRSSSILEQLRQQGAAGRPSEGEPREAGRRSFAGRRSRRNSTQDNESQISIENIGGSTDNLSVIGRNPDKEMRVHSGRKPEAAAAPPAGGATLRRGSANHQTFDIRKHSDEGNPDNEVKMFIDNKELEAMEKHEREGSPYGGKAQAQVVALNNTAEEKERKTSFADLRRKSNTHNQFATSGINLSYIQGDEKEDSPKRVYGSARPAEEEVGTPARAWARAEPGAASSPAPAALQGDEMNDRLNSVRMKLEERRKRIEEEKRKMEVVMSRQREKGGGSEQSALGNSWLSERGKVPGSPAQHPPAGPYSPNGHVNNSFQEMQTDIQKLATQQSQIQKMMQSPKPATPQNPMDPQPFYIAPGQQVPQQLPVQPVQPVQPSPQRRTWGQPQPINWNMPYSPMGGPRPPMYPPQQYPQYDQYGQPVVPRDQWGNPLPYGAAQQPVFDQYGQPYQQPYGQQPPGPYGMQPQPPQQQPNPYGQFAPQPYNSPYQSPQQPQLPYPALPSPGGTQARGTPFRLHDQASPGRPYEPTADPAAPRQYSRQNSRELVEPEPRRIHTALPAPAADDMAPQNVSFIENSTDNDDDDKSISPVPLAVPASGETGRTDSNLSERLSRLNISRGDKTYRVQLHADGREPTAVDQALASPRGSMRPTISSTFKERRRGSSEGSGPGSISGPASLLGTAHPPAPAVQSKLSIEEIDALNTMKTEVLNHTGDPAKGFVISFDDDSPIKPKPVLKPRRMSKKGSRDEMKSSDPVMIMLDMNEDGDDSESTGREVSPLRKMSSPGHRNRMNSLEHRLGSPSRYIDASQWNSFGEEGGLKSPDEQIIPKFEIDPSIPLEPMVALNETSDSDGSRPAGMIIGDEMVGNIDPNSMAAKKEKIIMQSLRRKQQAEENRIKREEKDRQRKEEEAAKAEEKLLKAEEDKRRKEAILEAFKQKKEQEKAEEEGRYFPAPVSAKPVPKIRPGAGGPKRPRPKTMVIDSKDVSRGARGSTSNLRARGSTSNLSNLGASVGDLRRSESRGSLADQERPGSSRSTMSLASMGNRPPSSGRVGGATPGYAKPTLRHPGSRRGSTANLEDQADSPGRSRAQAQDRTARSMSQPRGKRDSSVTSAYGASGRDRTDSYRGSRESLVSRRTYTARRGSNASLYEDEDDLYYGGSLRDVSYGGHSGRRKSTSSNYLGPGSLPSRRLGAGSREKDYDDGASDMSSQASGWSAYSHGAGGQRMYREPSVKSNRPIIMNSLEHAVFPGAVNKDTRMRVLDEIDACDCPHFLILFRDGKCQFRGLYAYYPDTDEVFKIYGTGPKQVTENMFETYFKYNSGGKKFTQIHTKSLTVTIDAFTIHNSLWLGKKTKLPDKRGMALVT